MKNFRDVLDSDTIQVFDGAMGTMLYSKGIYINRSYDELNLVAPDLVREVHTEYVRAGADIIETNTYSSTFHKLQPYGLEASLREINIKAAQIAREAAGNRVFVAGAVGPLGLRIEPYGPTSFDEAKAMFTAQASALLEGGVDLFVLETFSDTSELQQAIKAVQELCDLPIVAQMTIQIDGNTVFGATPEAFTAQLDEGARTSSVSTAVSARRSCSTRSKRCARLPRASFQLSPMPACPAMFKAGSSTCARQSTWPSIRAASSRPAR